jgi:arylsulfatase A
VPQAGDSASAAALLTGCYPSRIGIVSALGPKSAIGINDDETTLAEMFRARGYATAMAGTWGLGHQTPFLPTRHGFDAFLGLPYANDQGDARRDGQRWHFPDLPLIEGMNVVELDPDQRTLTRQYTDFVVQFIRRHYREPFFVYLAHTMPHVPLHVSQSFRGSSAAGLYGDVVGEIDWSVGRIVDTVDGLGLGPDTLIIFTSDNGPWLRYGDQAGSGGPLREGKTTTFEGGLRVPFIARWTDRVPAGHMSPELAMSFDLYPTLTQLAGGALPAHRIDGHDIGPILKGAPGARSPHEALFFYWGEDLQAVRSGRWKLHFPHPYKTPAYRPKGGHGQPAPEFDRDIGLSLFDLASDVGESRNVAPDHPGIVSRLWALAQQMRTDLGDKDHPGPGRRAPGRIPGR